MLHLSLEQLERDVWPAPGFRSYLVTRCHALRRVPIGQLSVEDLRMLISQGIGLKYLLPLAIETLEDDPLAEGDFFPGDLLSAVLKRDRADLAKDTVLLDRLGKICRRVLEDEREGRLPEVYGLVSKLRELLARYA